MIFVYFNIKEVETIPIYRTSEKLEKLFRFLLGIPFLKIENGIYAFCRNRKQLDIIIREAE